MENDRELLELAAKAAGVGLISWTNIYDACDEIGGRFITQPRGEPWNPLADDGDALRLAVRLGLEVITSGAQVVQAVDYVSKAYGEAKRGNDPYASTRLAIVRAAAAIGKAMK